MRPGLLNLGKAPPLDGPFRVSVCSAIINKKPAFNVGNACSRMIDRRGSNITPRAVLRGNFKNGASWSGVPGRRA
jgi:hypothetical protein